MALPNERQRTVERLARELGQLGATVTSVLPLADGQSLRFWVCDHDKRRVITALTDAGYEFIFLGMIMQPCVVTYNIELVNSFEVPIAREQRPPIQDRTIYGEVSQPKRTDVERQSVLRYLGLERKK